MNRILKRVLAGVTAAIVAVVAPAAVMAYGPTEGTDGRKYFDYKDTSTYPNYPAFNSFKNSPTWGFEPDFMSIKESTSNTWDSDDKITLQAGKTYDVVVFYHNNAPLNTNVAHNTKMQIEFPSVVKGGTDIKGTASISASNSTPRSVWSTLTFNSTNDMLIRYKQGSAFIKYSDGATRNLPNEGKDLFTNGQLVGRNFNGEVAGCDTNSGFVQFQIVADQPNFTVDKQVRVNNDGKATGGWANSVKANPGDTVDFLITYTNTGTIQQNNVVIKDILPDYLTYEKNSTVIYNATNPTSSGGFKDTTDKITSTGVNIGNYAPGANAMVKFSAKVANIDALKCGNNRITNTGRAETDNGSKTDTAIVDVTGKTCTPPTDEKECKPGIPEGDPRCEDTPPKEEDPPVVTPPTYPKTGPASVVGGIVGAGSLVTAAAYYVASRKNLS